DGGELIYCADDEGACEVARAAANERPDLLRIPYGLAAEGPFGVTELTRLPGRTRFSLRGWDRPFALRVPGDHNAVNAAAALCAVSRLAAPLDHAEAAAALERFSGTRRRSEVIGEAAGVLFLDDYGHHPTAIKKTLAGLRSFYPDRRIVVDFMSHTYSRTAALLEEFGACFGHADEVILHEIYASARENYDGSITGEDLAREVSRRHRHVRYIEKVAGAGGEIAEVLEPGDLFITMGAGNNWTLSHELFHSFSREPAET
ncbi:MAG: glutamate ligase domain-containing protein, partial [Spirochaetota bacterium]